MLNIFDVFRGLTGAFQILMFRFMRAWSCWCALNLLGWDQSRACLHLHDWNPGGFRLRNFWIPSVVWDYSAMVCKSCQCPWLGWGRRFTQGGNSCDQGRSHIAVARGLNSSGIRRLLDFNFQLEDFVCRLLPFWIHPKISSTKSRKISLSGVFGCWLLPFFNSHCSFPPF